MTNSYLPFSLLKQGGASDEDIHQLPKYKFRRISNSEKLGAGAQRPVGGSMIECDTESPIEHVLSAENVVSFLL